MANCTSIKYFERQIELFLIIRKFLNKYKIIKPLPRYLIKNQKKDDAILLKKQSQDYMYIIQLLLFLHFFSVRVIFLLLIGNIFVARVYFLSIF